jgi:hypothetical protein
MIKVDGMALQAAQARLQAAVEKKIRLTGLASLDCVRTEAGRLAETLVNISPPKSTGKARAQIKAKVNSTFTALGATNARMRPGGKEDVIWYQFGHNFAWGVAKDKDLRDGDLGTLYKLYFETKVTGKGRINVGQRGKQTFYLWQRWLTNPDMIAALIQKVQQHVGRLKASWLPSLDFLKSQGYRGGSYSPPGYVLAHRQGARGTFKNGLGVKGSPSFTLVSTATGAGSDRMKEMAKAAMTIRAEAIPKRLTQLIRHPELLGQEV